MFAIFSGRFPEEGNKSHQNGQESYDFTNMENIFKKKQINKQTKQINKLIDTESRMVVTRGGSGGVGRK